MAHSNKYTKGFIDQMIGLNAAGKAAIRKPELRDPDHLFGMFTGLAGDGIMEESRLLLYSRIRSPKNVSGSGPVVGQSTL